MRKRAEEPTIAPVFGRILKVETEAECRFGLAWPLQNR
jgi:hypothetical protein